MTKPVVFNINWVPWCPTPDDHKHSVGCRRRRAPASEPNYMGPWVVEDAVTTYHGSFEDALWEAHIRATEPTA